MSKAEDQRHRPKLNTRGQRRIATASARPPADSVSRSDQQGRQHQQHGYAGEQWPRPPAREPRTDRALPPQTSASPSRSPMVLSVTISSTRTTASTSSSCGAGNVTPQHAGRRRVEQRSSSFGARGPPTRTSHPARCQWRARARRADRTRRPSSSMADQRDRGEDEGEADGAPARMPNKRRCQQQPGARQIGAGHQQAEAAAHRGRDQKPNATDRGIPEEQPQRLMSTSAPRRGVRRVQQRLESVGAAAYAGTMSRRQQHQLHASTGTLSRSQSPSSTRVHSRNAASRLRRLRGETLAALRARPCHPSRPVQRDRPAECSAGLPNGHLLLARRAATGR